MTATFAHTWPCDIPATCKASTPRTALPRSAPATHKHRHWGVRAFTPPSQATAAARLAVCCVPTQLPRRSLPLRTRPCAAHTRQHAAAPSKPGRCGYPLLHTPAEPCVCRGYGHARTPTRAARCLSDRRPRLCARQPADSPRLLSDALALQGSSALSWRPRRSSTPRRCGPRTSTCPGSSSTGSRCTATTRTCAATSAPPTRAQSALQPWQPLFASAPPALLQDSCMTLDRGCRCRSDIALCEDLCEDGGVTHAGLGVWCVK